MCQGRLMSPIGLTMWLSAAALRAVSRARLSEDPNIRLSDRVRPRDRHPLIHIPLGVTWLINHATLNWRYWSTPQENLGGRSVYLPRGHVLGGSSSINGSIYIRGHRADYDDWAKWGNPAGRMTTYCPTSGSRRTTSNSGSRPIMGQTVR